MIFVVAVEKSGRKKKKQSKEKNRKKNVALYLYKKGKKYRFTIYFFSLRRFTQLLFERDRRLVESPRGVSAVSRDGGEDRRVGSGEREVGGARFDAVDVGVDVAVVALKSSSSSCCRFRGLRRRLLHGRGGLPSSDQPGFPWGPSVAFPSLSSD